MQSNINGEDIVFDVGSLYAHLQVLKDGRKPRDIRYPLVAILVMMVMVKLCGEDTLSGIAKWVKHRAEQFIDMLKLKRKHMPHHSTYRRVETEVVDPQELEQLVSSVLAGRKFFGKQVLLSIDGKVLRGTLDEARNGTYLLAAYLTGEGLALMEVELEGKGCEIPGALKLSKMIDLREKVVMGDAMHTQKAASIQILEGQAVITSGSSKVTNRNWKKISACGLNPNQTHPRTGTSAKRFRDRQRNQQWAW